MRSAYARLGRIALVTAACLLSIISCRGSATQNDTVITVLGEDSSNLRAMQELASQFVKQLRDRGESVRIEFKPKSFEDAQTAADTALSNGRSDYDIILQYNFSLANYASHNYVFRAKELAPLVPEGTPEAVRKSLFDSVWREVGWYYKSGSHSDEAIEPIGYPFAANTMLLVYNNRFLADRSLQRRYHTIYNNDLQPATTWKQFMRQADFFKKASAAHCGIALQGKADGWLYYEWMNFLFGFGGEVMNKQHGWQGNAETKLELNTPAAVAAATAYKALKPDTCGDFFNIDAPTQRQVLLDGKAPMALVWSDYLFDLVQQSKKGGQSFRFVPVPGDKSMIAGGAFYINRHSKHPDLAAQFIFFLLDPKNQEVLVKKGLCSPLLSIYKHPERYPTIPYVEALGTSLERGRYMLEAGPDSNMISREITITMQGIWRGADVQTSLADLQRSLTTKRSQVFSKPEDS